MKRKGRLRFVIVAVLALMMIIAIPMAAVAAPSLEWQTERVYYDLSDQLVIEGYFFNNGTATINWVNWMRFQVFFRRQYSDWWLQAEATFEKIDVFLPPGDAIRWQFNITDVDYQRFDYWNVRYSVNFNYQY
jgi:hypothetical protein